MGEVVFVEFSCIRHGLITVENQREIDSYFSQCGTPEQSTPAAPPEFKPSVFMSRGKRSTISIIDLVSNAAFPTSIAIL